MADLDDAERLDEQIASLEQSLGGAQSIAASFNSELAKLQSTMGDTSRDVMVLSGGISRGLRRSFDGLIFDGMKLSDALRGVAKTMIDTAYSAAIKPVTQQLGGLLAGGVQAVMGARLPFADGGGFAQGRVMPFAAGGVFSGPHAFPMRGGMGLLGEAGPEAILPLSRGTDGKLGVRSGGQGRVVNVVVNVATPDVEGFRRSQTQIAAQMSRALGRGDRNR